MSIRLHTLGGLKVFKDGEEVENLRSWKRRLGLLIYIAYKGETPRDHLTGLLWPEKPERKARSSLSTAVSDLRKACGRDCIETQGEIYRINREVSLDVLEFQDAVDRGNYQEALTRYEGPFLAGISLIETSPFQQWVGSVHSRLTGLHRKARFSEIERLTQDGNILDALSHARRWVELEPEDDGPVQVAMRLLAMDGRRAEALHQYEAFQRAMALIDEEPLEETVDLAEKIRSGEEVGPARTLAMELPRPERVGVEDGESRREPEAGSVTKKYGARPGPGPGPPHPWVVELAETLKDWWVFRGVLAFFTVAFVGIGVADGLGVPPRTVRMLLAMAVGCLILIAPTMWILEPWARRQLGFPPPRTWRDVHREERRLSWRHAGSFLLLAGAVAISLSMMLWPEHPGSVADPSPPELPGTRLAILPVIPADSSDEELRRLSTSISQETVSHFRTFEALRVPPWRWVAGYTDPTLSPDSILQELEVDYFLSGIVSREGDSLHFRWDLEDGQSVGEQIDVMVAAGPGASQIDLLRNVIDQVTRRVRQELGEIIGTRRLRLGTTSQAAWAALEEARRMDGEAMTLLGSDFSRSAWAARQADSLFALAANLDPDWPEPLILRAHATQHLAATGWLSERLPDSLREEVPLAPDAEERAELGRRALEYLEEALSLDPGNRDAHYCRAALLLEWGTFFQRLTPSEEEEQLRRAEEDLQRAAQGATPHPEAMGLLAVLLARDRGDYLQASRYGREALRQDPWLEARRDVTYQTAMALFEMGEDEEALGYCRDSNGITYRDPGTILMQTECQLMIMALSDLPGISPDSAWALLERTVLRDEEGTTRPGVVRMQDYRDRGLLLYAGVLQAAGLPDSAMVIMDRIEEVEESDLAAGILARLGMREEGFEKLQKWLERTDPERSGLVVNSRVLRFLRGYPAFDSLRARLD